MSTNRANFDELMRMYNNQVEPLCNWTTSDLVALIDAVDSELQNRSPPDSIYNAVHDSDGDDA